MCGILLVHNRRRIKKMKKKKKRKYIYIVKLTIKVSTILLVVGLGSFSASPTITHELPTIGKLFMLPILISHCVSLPIPLSLPLCFPSVSCSFSTLRFFFLSQITHKKLPEFFFLSFKYLVCYSCFGCCREFDDLNVGNSIRVSKACKIFI